MAWEIVAVGLGGAAIGVLGSLAVGWRQNRSAAKLLALEHNHQIKVRNRQEQHQVFSRLMGQKFMLAQLYVSRFEALIHSDYHEVKWKLIGAPAESLDLQEAQRWMHRSEELALNIASNIQTLFESIGLIHILFLATPTLEKLINRIYHFKTPAIKVPPEGSDSSQLESWKINAVKQLQGLVEKEYAHPIEELLNYLASELSD